MLKSIDTPIANIAIYRLDIYRLLTLLLADKQIANNTVFAELGNDNFDTEVNRLLILVAAITRQLLENIENIDEKIKPKLNIDFELKNNQCGDFWCNYPVEKNPRKLKFNQACSMIIHATDIVIKPTSYYYKDKQENSNKKEQDKKEHELYFQNKITVEGKKKERADIDVKKFAQYCIKLSNQFTKEINHANK